MRVLPQRRFPNLAGAKDGQLVSPDVEPWFKQAQFQGKPSLVAQRA